MSKEIRAITTSSEGVFSETYPNVTQCPLCESEDGDQSFDIWVCNACGEWPYIAPIESKRIGDAN